MSRVAQISQERPEAAESLGFGDAAVMATGFPFGLTEGLWLPLGYKISSMPTARFCALELYSTPHDEQPRGKGARCLGFYVKGA
jgi:hypothetical protein